MVDVMKSHIKKKNESNEIIFQVVYAPKDTLNIIELNFMNYLEVMFKRFPLSLKMLLY